MSSQFALVTPTELEDDEEFKTELANLLARAEAMGTGTGTAGLPYLKYQNGKFHDGREVVPFGTRFVAYIRSASEGWIKWQDHKPVDRQFVPMGSGLPRADRATLGDHDKALWPMDNYGRYPRDPWQPDFELRLRELEGEQREMILTGANLEGVIKKLLLDYGHRRRGKLLPVIELRAGELWIVGWIDELTLIEYELI